MADPTLPASGKVTRLGTKKTGSHLAKSAAPGLRALNNPSPNGKVSSVMNRPQQPPSDEGKEMARLLNSFRNPMSNANSMVAENMDLDIDGSLPFLLSTASDFAEYNPLDRF